MSALILTAAQQVVFPDGSSMTKDEYISYARNQGGLTPVGKAGGHVTRDGLVITTQGTLKTLQQMIDHNAALAANCKKWRSNHQGNSQNQCVIRPRVNLPPVAESDDPLKRDQMELNALTEYSHKNASMTMNIMTERMDKQRQLACKGKDNSPTHELGIVPTRELVNPPTPELVNAPTSEGELVDAPTGDVGNAPTREQVNAPAGEMVNAPTSDVVIAPKRKRVNTKQLQFPLSSHRIDIKMDSSNEYELSVSGAKHLQFLLEDHFGVKKTQGLGLCIQEVLKLQDLPQRLVQGLKYLNKERVAITHKRGTDFLRDPDKFYDTLQDVLHFISPNARIVHCQSPLEQRLRRELSE